MSFYKLLGAKHSKCSLKYSPSVPDHSWFSSSVRMGGFVPFARRATLLRVKRDWEQSAVNPVRERT